MGQYLTKKNSSRVMGLFDNDLETNGKHIFKVISPVVSKLWDKCISEKGA
jgi:hypothetical protein